MRKQLVLFAGALALIAGSPSFAHEGHHGGGPMGACGKDMKKFCGDIKMGDPGAMMACMQSHAAEVSDACKAEHAKMKARMDAVMAACRGDMDTLCKDVAKDDHRAMHDCMMKNEAKLSEACKAEHGKMMEMAPMGHHGISGPHGLHDPAPAASAKM